MLAPRTRRSASAVALAAAIATVMLGVASTSVAAKPKAGTVFYTGAGNAGYDRATPYAEQDIRTGDWTGPKGECAPAKSVSSVSGKPSTLSGWSLGRLGPVYYLEAASRDRREAVRNVLLFDPATYGTMTSSCDAKVDVDGILASWLKLNGHNRLIIMAGLKSLDVVGSSCSTASETTTSRRSRPTVSPAKRSCAWWRSAEFRTATRTRSTSMPR